MKKKKRKASSQEKLRRWVLKELEKYIKLHKQHEKDLRYIA
ncbi:MAG: hypothetical protein NZ942_01125 [Candidatus Aenigmarchaeota archaeon]|nr:hypothetical protein [Candidatus Aenigmarchaeota archaeon]